MAAKLLKSDWMLGMYPEVTASGGNDNVPIRAEFDVSAALEGGDVIEMFVVPPGYCVHDLVLGVTALDTDGTPAIDLAVGILEGAPGDPALAKRVDSGGDIDPCFIEKTDVAQAGGVARMDTLDGMLVEPQEDPYSVGVQVTTAPAAGATSGKIVINATLRPAYRGK